MSIQAVLCTLLRLLVAPSAAAAAPAAAATAAAAPTKKETLTWSRRGRPGPLAGR